MNAHWTERLSEYLDGDLSPAERETCEAHLDACADCARLLEELKSVVAEAGALPLVPPPAGLWDAIESRLETPVLQLRPRAAVREKLERRWSFSGFQLAAAAAALVAVTAGVVWMAVRGGVMTPMAPASNGQIANVTPAAPQTSVVAPPADDSIAPPSSAETSPEAANSPVQRSATPEPLRLATRPSPSPDRGVQLATNDLERRAPTIAADFGIGRYDAAIAELESSIAAQRTMLDSSTVRIVAQNLAIIDKAIDDARTALAADPSSRYLNAHLASTMRRKVDMLRRVNSLARI